MHLSVFCRNISWQTTVYQRDRPATKPKNWPFREVCVKSMKFDIQEAYLNIFGYGPKLRSIPLNLGPYPKLFKYAYCKSVPNFMLLTQRARKFGLVQLPLLSPNPESTTLFTTWYNQPSRLFHTHSLFVWSVCACDAISGFCSCCGLSIMLGCPSHPRCSRGGRGVHPRTPSRGYPWASFGGG